MCLHQVRLHVKPIHGNTFSIDVGREEACRIAQHLSSLCRVPGSCFLLKFRGKYVTSVDGAESGEVLHMVLRSPLLGGVKQG